MSNVTPITRIPRIKWTHEKIDVNHAFTVEPPAIDFVLPGFVAGTVGSIVAPGATGKSFWSLQAAIQIAGGPDSLGLGELDTGIVSIVAAEDPALIIRHRLHDLGSRLSPSERDRVAENLVIQPAVGQTIDVRDRRWVETLIDLAENSRLLILDTFRRMQAADENSSSEMAEIVGILETIAEKSGASILFLHHTNKASMAGGGGDQQAARGSSVITDDCRWQSFLCCMSEREARDFGVTDERRKMYVRWGASKINYGAQIEDCWYRRGSDGLTPVKLEKIAHSGSSGRPGDVF